MPRSVGPSTVKKNIERESQHYFVRHKTHKFIQKLAEKDERPIGSYLDVLIEREARKLLHADQVCCVSGQQVMEPHSKRAAQDPEDEIIIEGFPQIVNVITWWRSFLIIM